MINKKELRIGNIIYDATRTIRPVEYIGGTIGLTNDIGGTDKYQHDPIFSYDIDMLSPVELSASILKKCGFKKDEQSMYGGWLIKLNEGESMRIVNYDSIGWHWPMNGYNKPVVNYLHQLQNLYHGLTGKELNINL